MIYNGEQHNLLIDIDQELSDPESLDDTIYVPVLNTPFTHLVYHHNKHAMLVEYDINSDVTIQAVGCELTQHEVENIHRIYYPIYYPYP